MNPVKTDFLVSTGSFFIGLGTVMNLSGNYFQYNYSRNGEEADKHAIYRDWRVIGQEIEKVVAAEIQESESKQLQLALA
jgi:hypothetical protein